MTAWFYILRLESGALYLGATTDLERRLQEHGSGKAGRTTRARTRRGGSRIQKSWPASRLLVGGKHRSNGGGGQRRKLWYQVMPDC